MSASERVCVSITIIIIKISGIRTKVESRFPVMCVRVWVTMIQMIIWFIHSFIYLFTSYRFWNKNFVAKFMWCCFSEYTHTQRHRHRQSLEIILIYTNWIIILVLSINIIISFQSILLFYFWPLSILFKERTRKKI